MTQNRFEELEKTIGFSFKSKDLLEEALTHKSSIRGKRSAKPYNERLEFFGDAVLKFIMSEYLFNRYPDYDEGQLSKCRSQLVSDKYMEALAKAINLGQYIFLSSGERRSGGASRPSILANAMEALLGACYFDQGIEAVRSMFLNLYAQYGSDLEQLNVVDYKSELQEMCQKRQLELPKYRLIRSIGPGHDQSFVIEACVAHPKMALITQGVAKTKKDAEQSAAQALIGLFQDIAG